MAKLTIIEGNSNEKDNVRAYMVKGEPGDDGVSPTVNVSRAGTTVTITATDAEGTTASTVSDGISPVITTSKTSGVTTVTIVDAEGTKTAAINDGETYEVPTGAVVGFDGATVPGGYEEVDNPNNYTTTETVIGTWINGKPLYRKVVDFGYLPNTSSKTVNSGLSNVKVLSITATAIYDNDGTTLTIPDTHGSYPMRILFNSSNQVEINTQNDRSSFYTYVILEYIKTTD